MRLVGEANRYVTDTAPFKLKAEDEEPRLRTILWVLAQVVSDLNTMFSPFLPHSANQIDLVMGGDGSLAPMPHLEWVQEESEDGTVESTLGEAVGTPEDQDPDAALAPSGKYPVITGDYSSVPAWERRAVVPGTPIAKPQPVFTKLDPEIVKEELARYAGK